MALLGGTGGLLGGTGGLLGGGTGGLTGGVTDGLLDGLLGNVTGLIDDVLGDGLGDVVGGLAPTGLIDSLGSTLEDAIGGGLPTGLLDDLVGSGLLDLGQLQGVLDGAGGGLDLGALDLLLDTTDLARLGATLDQVFDFSILNGATLDFSEVQNLSIVNQQEAQIYLTNVIAAVLSVPNDGLDPTQLLNAVLSGNDRLTDDDQSHRLRGGGGNDTIFGMGGDDTLDAGNGNDVLYGGAGRDSLSGGAGNDVFYGGQGADRISGGEGIDYARYDEAGAGNLKLSLANPANNTGIGTGDTYNSIEGLISGSGNDTIGGNNFQNYLYGGGGNDLIAGFGGNDKLFGQAGRDTFLFQSALDATTNVDTIGDYNVADDTIWLDNAFMPGLGSRTGALNANAFHVGAGAADASDRIIYNVNSGALLYDADGLGGAAAIKFAQLSTGLSVTAADFVVI